jgi:hypothetical protein
MRQKPDPINEPKVARPAPKAAAKRRRRRPTVKEAAVRVVRAFERTFRELARSQLRTRWFQVMSRAETQGVRRAASQIERPIHE